MSSLALMPIDPEIALARKVIGQAKCSGADHVLFEATNWRQGEAAIKLCMVCPIKGAVCLSWIRPKPSYFDGVCDGSPWRDGRRVPKPSNQPSAPKNRLACGTQSGVYRHGNNGEYLCAACARVQGGKR